MVRIPLVTLLVFCSGISFATCFFAVPLATSSRLVPAAARSCGRLRPSPRQPLGKTSCGIRHVRPALSLTMKAETDFEQAASLVQRLEKNLADLTELRASVKSEVEELEGSLAEKKASLTLIEDRLERVTSEIQTARTEQKIASTEIVPAIIVGDGRVGQMMRENGDTSDVMVRSTSEMKFQLKKNPGGSGKDGPIYLCVPNSALEELVDACPEERRKDLVFMGSGNLGDFLEDKKLSDCTQALIYFVIGKLGDDPIDGVAFPHPLLSSLHFVLSSLVPLLLYAQISLPTSLAPARPLQT